MLLLVLALLLTKFVKSYALVVGNPARQIGWMSRYGQRLNFNQDGFAQCTESLDWYELKNEEVIFLGKK